jgi:hypothetical protein
MALYEHDNLGGTDRDLSWKDDQSALTWTRSPNAACVPTEAASHRADNERSPADPADVTPRSTR